MRTAVGPRPRRLPVLPGLFVLLSLLTLIPVGQALIELIVRPVTVSQLVDRRVGLSTKLVAVDGYALLEPFDAEPPPDAGQASSPFIYHWYAVRDSLQERRIVLVRSIIATDGLRTRSVVARVVDDPSAVHGASQGLVARGGTDHGAAVAPVLLTELDPGDASVRQLASLAELGQASVGQIVRVTLRFHDGIASCVARGSCDARMLANGIGSWDNLATDPAGSGWVVVRTGYPPSVAPFHGVGHHAQDRDLLERFLAQPLVRGVLGWAEVLRVAHVEHDLGLPIDHLWLGPIVFTSFGALLLVGLGLGYPRFRAGALSDWSSAPQDPRPGRAIGCRATGRISPPDASPFEVRDVAATLRADERGGSDLTLQLASGRREVLVPRNLGGLGSTEIGDLLVVRGSLPALKVSWFGSNVLLVFGDRPDRDEATALVRRRG